MHQEPARRSAPGQTSAEAAEDNQAAEDSQAAEDISASITELQNVLLGTESIEKFVQALAVQAAQVVAGSLSCGITLRSGTQNTTVACSDEQATAVNDLQYQLLEGPCLTALADQALVRVDDLAAESRWPRFTPAAAGRGVRSCLSLPLMAQDAAVGALNFYSPQAGAFGAEETRRAEMFADPAAGALALGLRLVTYSQLVSQLRHSLTSRAVIDQAVGVIMGQERCTQDKAFAALRTASQNRNVKLRDIAREVVMGVTGEEPAPPPFETA
jgi:transcriptional regulator with GAF, ATPase, and Fis domain